MLENKQDVFKEHYQKLNEAQQEAVDTIEGPVLVIAGPGSGKTELLSMRAAQIMRKSDIYASGILCLTFTESAEINMRQRLTEIIGPEGYRIGVHTFHNFCRDIKNRYSEFFDQTAFFDVADNIVKIEILEDIITDLDHDNPLRSEHPEFGFNYLKPARSAISDLKQAGLNPDELAAILDQNDEFIEATKEQVNQVFSLRTTDEDMLPALAELAERFAAYEAERIVPTFRPLSEVLARKLTHVIEEAQENDSSKPITAFKSDHTRKVKDKRVLKAGTRERARYLVDVYRAYEKEKYKRGYHDFDDLILDVITALESNETLRAAVSEEFQYIQVDEFQDTNDAQLRLLMAIAGEDPENQPNIMTVGDDDQSIYRFQGAEVGNIMNFADYFADPTIITMTKNYRSTQSVLDQARHVITQGENRLEVHLESIEKELEAAGDPGEETEGVLHELPTRTHHNRAVAAVAKELIDDGTDPEEIAVISRYHADLEALVPYFHELEIPIAYKRQQNVLNEPHIRQLITMCRFIHELNSGDMQAADSRLPKILSFNFWDIDRSVIWELSLAAHKKRVPWLELMQEHEDEHIKELAVFFIQTAQKATFEPAEEIIDRLIGADITDQISADAANADTISGLPTNESGDFVSPFKNYYFHPDKLENQPATYLRFLSSLKTFVYALREHKEGKILSVEDVINFVDTHEKNNELVTDTSPFINSENAVTLTTAHGAKGLEFDAVILAAAVDDVWAKSKHHRRIYFPENLPVSYEGDTQDDHIRLLYVAMTRARQALHVMSFSVDDSGEEQKTLSFLADIDMEKREDHTDLPSTTALLESTVPDVTKGPYVGDEKDLLLPLIENYRLSVTHLNNFIDVRYGGPQNFLSSNLLRFPQPMSKHLVYGDAIHTTLEKIYKHIESKDNRPSVDTVLEWFTEEIDSRRINEATKTYLKERGQDALTIFWKKSSDTFAADHLSEFSFAREGVVVDDVPLSGKIDKIVPSKEEQFVVHDFKTGSSFDTWSKSSVKSLQYQRQLVFYKLLVENSRSFADKRVNAGVIDFVEPKDGDIVRLSYDITQEDVTRLRRLIQVVYQHITNLNFPDVSSYKQNARGVRAFCDDLLSGEI